MRITSKPDHLFSWLVIIAGVIAALYFFYLQAMSMGIAHTIQVALQAAMQ